MIWAWFQHLIAADVSSSMNMCHYYLCWRFCLESSILSLWSLFRFFAWSTYCSIIISWLFKAAWVNHWLAAQSKLLTVTLCTSSVSHSAESCACYITDWVLGLNPYICTLQKPVMAIYRKFCPLTWHAKWTPTLKHIRFCFVHGDLVMQLSLIKW